MKFYFHPHADADLDEAIRYYEECQLGLGLDLAEEVYSAIRRASEYPEAWSAMSKNTRRCLVNRFPYGVIFQIKSGENSGVSPKISSFYSSSAKMKGLAFRL